MSDENCQDCKHFACAGYHYYECVKRDEQRSPFDQVCNDYEPEE